MVRRFIRTVQLILDHLVNGPHPSYISLIIASQDDLAMPRVKVIVKELPGINFIWSYRMILQMIGETLGAYHIWKVEEWDKLFSEGTGRCQTAPKNFFIGFINEGRLHILILSTSVILKGETSEHHFYSLLSIIEGCRKRLQLWEDVLEHSHLSYQHNISDLSSMNTRKLGVSGPLTSDTCNGVRNTRRLIVEKVHEAAETLHKDDSDDIRVLEVDC